MTIELACTGRPTLAVGKIVAVGRNYADHAREMGHAPLGADHTREMAGTHDPAAEPILFLKPQSALVLAGPRDGRCEVALPSFSRLVHHEVELVVRIGRACGSGARLTLEQARASVDAIAIGLDLTARDLQAAARKRGDPWSVAKGFDGSAPLSALVPFEEAATPGRLARLELSLAVNGAPRQRGRTADLLTPVPELVAFVSSRFRLEPGDLLFTGTPAGVGPLVAGDIAVAELAESGAAGPLARLEVRCLPPR